MTVGAFHNDPEIKANHITKFKQVHYSDYLIELGIPIQLLSLVNKIHLDLLSENENGLKWLLEFFEAIPVGANLMIPYWQFMHWLLVSPNDGVVEYAKYMRAKKAIEAIAALYAKKMSGEVVEAETWDAALAAARDVKKAAKGDEFAMSAAIEVANDDGHMAVFCAGCAAYLDAGSSPNTLLDRKRKRHAEKLIELVKLAPIAD